MTEKERWLHKDSVFTSGKEIAAFILISKDKVDFCINDLIEKYHLNAWGVYCGVQSLVEQGFISAPKTETNDSKNKSFITYIYLMRDSVNNFYKIGNAKQPKFRERTLQSEKPTIELLFAWEGDAAEEKTLHNFFIDKRIRGEWFKLEGADIEIIKNRFRTRKQLEF